MHWAILTSNQVRHRFVANLLAARHSVGAVVVEPKSRDPRMIYAHEDDRALLEAYYNDRDASELQLLPEGREWALLPGSVHLEVAPKEINSEEVVSALRGAGVNACVVFGTSILKGIWMSAYGGRMLNIHLGLSPYYRGAGTNLWALYDGRPELVGATLHQISPVVDAGDIYCQVRPCPDIEDTPHSLGNKTIREAAVAMDRLMEEFEKGTARPSRATVTAGSEYRYGDFDAGVVRRVLERFASGLMAEYCRDQEARRGAYPLVNERLACHDTSGIARKVGE
jgi:phosphoribosylglycinamide formyltransferase 1